MSLRYALIGCGRIATNHIKAVLNNELDLVAVCDVIPEQMEQLLAKHDLQGNPSIHRYTDHKELLRQEKPDLVAIATESGAHAAIALDCIRAGVHTIIEKPIAMSMADADAIVKAAKEYDVVVSVCHQNRFNIAVQKTKQALDEGRFGKLSHGSIHVRWNRNENYY
ncbi:MAG: Gfo/Idh/MocA family oxidoreductase, partial [Lachnospiraceae bacterium]|nr:Gfo/Idh/MocA family oxidoreductase [Lachnospiraceae bacterium]